MVVRRMLEKEMIAKNVICETTAISVYFMKCMSPIDTMRVLGIYYPKQVPLTQCVC
jgi:hypothetical protein